MGLPVLYFVTATPGAIAIDAGNGTAHPYPQSKLFFVWDDAAQTLRIQRAETDGQPIIAATPFANFTCNVDGSPVSIANYAALIAYVTQYLHYVASSGGGGGTATATNQALQITQETASATALGTTADTAATDSTSAWSIVSILKGLYALFVNGLTIFRTAKIILISPTNTTTAYAAGMCVGGLQTVNSAYRVNGGNMILESISVTDGSNTKAAMDILFFSALPSIAPADHTVITAGIPSDIPKFIGKVSVVAGNYQSYGSVNPFAIATITNIGLMLNNSAGNNRLYFAIVTQGTPTYSSTTALNVNLGLDQY